MNKQLTIPTDQYYKVIEIVLKNVAAAYGRKWQEILPDQVQTEHKHISLYLMTKYVKIVALKDILGSTVWYAASVGWKLIDGFKKNKLIAEQVDREITKHFDTGYVADFYQHQTVITVESKINTAA